MRAGIYVRVSTREQAREGYSIQAQLNRLKAFCESQGWDVSGVYNDEGLSAKDTNRPQRQEMIKDLKNDKLDVVLVYRLDRLTRSVFDLYNLLETFDKYKCGFKSATEVYDTTTAMGRLFITIVAALAQWEREDLAENVAMGLEEKVSQGLFPGGFPPYGFDVKNDRLIPNPKESEVVRSMYEKYASGNSMNDIARHLNDRDIRTRRGNFWYRSVVGTTLKSEYVRGNTFWKGEVYKNTHEAIVDKQTIKQVDWLLKRNTKRTTSNQNQYIFSSTIKCKGCGSNLHGSYSSDQYKTYYFYRCSNRKMGICKDNNTTVSEARLEEKLLEKLSKVDFSKVIEETDIKQNNDNIKKKKELEQELNKIEERKKKWQIAWVEDLISSDDLKKRMDEESEREKEVINQLNEFEEIEEVEFDEEEVKRLLNDITRNWDELNRKEKRQLIQSLIDSIEYEKEGRDVIIREVNFIV